MGLKRYSQVENTNRINPSACKTSLKTEIAEIYFKELHLLHSKHPTLVHQSTRQTHARYVGAMCKTKDIPSAKKEGKKETYSNVSKWPK